MADGFVQIRAGEKRPLYGQAAAASGTLTIIGTPTCTLYDSAGNAVAGLNGINVTGFDNTALATVKAWYDLDTTTPALLTAGFYTLVFVIQCTGSDGIARTYEPSVTVQVLAVTS